eukprot:350834-Chlamydomonas_euryale.AAC.7
MAKAVAVRQHASRSCRAPCIGMRHAVAMEPAVAMQLFSASCGDPAAALGVVASACSHREAVTTPGRARDEVHGPGFRL